MSFFNMPQQVRYIYLTVRCLCSSVNTVGTKTIFMSDKKHITVCRVAYCEECYKNHRPSKQDIFCTIGRTHQKYTVRVVEYWGTRGFTPHIITITSIEHDKVIFTSYCAIHGCGCNISYNEDTEKYLIQPINYATLAIEKRQWNALIMYKNDDDYILA